MTRLEKMRESGIEPALPIIPAPCFVGWLMDAGPTEVVGASMDGAVRQTLSWGAIAQWEEGSGISLAPWQKRLLRQLSGDWLAAADRAKKVDCPPPWQPEQPFEINREAVGRKVVSIFDRLSQPRKA